MTANHDIYVRAYAVHIDKEGKGRKGMDRDEKKWPDHVLVFDCESRTTPDLSLTFGFWRFCELRNNDYVCTDEGIFHADADLCAKESHFLRAYTKKTKPETTDDGSDRLRLYSRKKFVEEVLGIAIEAKALIVGFNLPFDLSRIALDWNPAEDGGWTLILKQWHNPQTNKVESVESFPRVIIKALNSKAAFITSSRPPVSFRKSNGKRARLWPAARFLDLRTLLWGMRNKSFSLQTVQFYGNAANPAGTSSWSMRAQIAFLFPKLTPEQKKLMMEEQLKKLEQEQQKAPEKK